MTMCHTNGDQDQQKDNHVIINSTFHDLDDQNFVS